jgi:hypothetical protein
MKSWWILKSYRWPKSGDIKGENTDVSPSICKTPEAHRTTSLDVHRTASLDVHRTTSLDVHSTTPLYHNRTLA